jgi:hypothetical protein
MASIALLLHRVAPSAPAIVATSLAGLSGSAALALALTLEDAALLTLTQAIAAGVALIVLGALADQETRLRLASFASAAFGVGLALWLTRTARRRQRLSWPLAALFAITLALLCAYAAFLVLASRDLMIADFMTYRGIAIMVARLADARNWPLLMTAVAQSITQDYSWAPGLVPRPPAGGDRADVARCLYVRTARPLRRAGRLCTRDPGARLRAPRRASTRRACRDHPGFRRRRCVRRFCGRVRGRRARHTRCWRAGPGRLRAQAGGASRPTARCA